MQNQNDSLNLKLEYFNNVLGKTNTSISNGFEENKFYLKNIKDKVGSKKRYISKEQRSLIIDKLSKIDNLVVPIACAQYAPVNCDYAHELKDIFIAAGGRSWVNRSIGGLTNSSELKGIVLILKNPDKIPRNTEIIYQVLQGAKLDVDAKFFEEYSKSFEIWIGD